jgi:hypothetical protein
MRTALAYLAGFFTALIIWIIYVLYLGYLGVQVGALPAAIIGGFAVWVGTRVVDFFKKPDAEAIDSRHAERINEAIESETEVSDPPPKNHAADDGNTPPEKSREAPKIFKISNNAILFLLAGLVAGYFVRHYFGPEEFAVPQTRAECYVAIAEAQTELGAGRMVRFCRDTFEDF